MTLINMSLEQLEKIRIHSVVSQLCSIFEEYNGAVCLTGGAIIDILSSRTPKDYDLIVNRGVNYKYLISFLLTIPEKFIFVCTTKYATTFKFKAEHGTHVVQVLHHGVEQFDFTISQGQFAFQTKLVRVFSGLFDNFSFKRKELFPVSYDPKSLLNCLCRVTKYKQKGFTMSDVTFDSVVNTLAQTHQNSS